MKKLFRKKVLLILLAITLLGGGAVYFFVFRDTASNSINAEPVEIKVDTVFGYIGSESTYSRFNNLIGMFDSAKYLAKNETGLEPSLIVFAPSNDAFDKEDAKPLDNASASSREQIKLYHLARVYPSTETTNPNLELTDGQKIVTLSGRELFVSKKDDFFMVTDAKGREATVSKRYATSAKGDRIYFIDQVLLFQ